MKKYASILVLALLAIIGVYWWVQFAMPRYQYIDLSVKQDTAITVAKEYLRAQGYKSDGYKIAAIFESDDATDRYLQRTIGTSQSQKLIKTLDYDIFGWLVRFYKEKQKEEFAVFVSSKSGKVIGFNHAIEETAARPTIDKEQARLQALAFLKERFGFDPHHYTLHSDNSTKQLNRTDHKFTWESTHVDIPWKQEFGGGSAKLITMVTISGTEVLSFSRANFDIPEGFNRYVDNLKQTGRNLTLVFRIVYLFLLTMAIMMVVNRKNHFVGRAVKSFYLKIGIFLYILLIFEVVNSYQYLLFEYQTTQSFGDYLVRRFVENLVNPFFVVLAFILPGLAGESLRFEVDGENKNRGFLSTIRSSFFTKVTSNSIMIGYALCAFILGAQAFIFDLGYQYCGVWEELSWLTRASSSAFPAITAVLIGVEASFSEEIMFRLFGINLLKRYKLGAVAVFLTAIMWGVGHTGYPIFPMWFRGVEVTCLGIILGFAYLRFGLVAVITAHYLMDAFLTSMPYLLVPKFGVDFYSSVLVLSIPLLLAIAGRILNRSTQEKEVVECFNAQQQFHYGLLLELAQSRPVEAHAQLRQDLIKHGWDPAVVEKVFKKG